MLYQQCQRCLTKLKAGVNSLLDVARQTYKEANADAAELVSKLGGKVKCSSSEA